MRISTAIILAIGATPILWVGGWRLWAEITAPWLIYDVSIALEVYIIEWALCILAVGVLKWLLIDRRIG